MQATPAPSQTNQQQNIAVNSSTSMPNNIPANIAMPAVPPTQPTISIDTFKLKMKQKLDAAKEVLQTHQREMDRTTTYFEESKSNVVTLEQRSADACNRFTFFQDLRQFTNDLVECINEKVS